ncbi:MAG TPA: sigma-70 family RNA polymerase sigma factor [Candidatus Polarisedimenticolaceae bacterium]|nr:sigma-70 family RNA polymerase sigma factor [Candidatus Polarisedimenticolaceae bacterium]
MADEDDRDAVSRVLAGEAGAFDGIVRQWQGPLVSLAYRFTRDRGRAEDLAQEAFLRAYRALDRYRGDARFSTWLFALAVNLYRSEIRRVPPPTVSLDDVREPAAPAADDDDKTIHAALHALPPKYRDVLLLYYFHEMDVASAARSLDLPEGTVKARLARGRELLRRKLDALSHAPRLEEAR